MMTGVSPSNLEHSLSSDTPIMGDRISLFFDRFVFLDGQSLSTIQLLTSFNFLLFLYTYCMYSILYSVQTF